MKKFLLICFSLVAFAGLAFGQEVGHVSAVKGSVLIHGNPKTIPAVLEEKIHLKDTIETKSGGRVKLLFIDDSLLTISENSKVSVKEFIYKADGSRGRAIFNILEGNMKSLVGKSKFEVHTPTAVAAARGTYFTVWVTYENGLPVTWIAVLEGVVDASNSSGAGGIMPIGKGKMTKITKDGGPSEPVPIPPQLENELLGCDS